MSEDVIKSLNAQLDAHKQELNDSITKCLNLRANLIWLQNINQGLAAEVDALKKQVQEANLRIDDLQTVPEQNPVCQ